MFRDMFSAQDQKKQQQNNNIYIYTCTRIYIYMDVLGQLHVCMCLSMYIYVRANELEPNLSCVQFVVAVARRGVTTVTSGSQG